MQDGKAKDVYYTSSSFFVRDFTAAFDAESEDDGDEEAETKDNEVGEDVETDTVDKEEEESSPKRVKHISTEGIAKLVRDKIQILWWISTLDVQL